MVPFATVTPATGKEASLARKLVFGNESLEKGGVLETPAKI